MHKAKMHKCLSHYSGSSINLLVLKHITIVKGLFPIHIKNPTANIPKGITITTLQSPLVLIIKPRVEKSEFVSLFVNQASEPIFFNCILIKRDLNGQHLSKK